MTQAFGIQGRTLSDNQAEELLPGWRAAFRSVATEHLEMLREIGMEKGCKNTKEFLDAYAAWAADLAADCDYRAERRKQEEHRAAAVATGASAPSRAKLMEKYGVQ